MGAQVMIPRILKVKSALDESMMYVQEAVSTQLLGKHTLYSMRCDRCPLCMIHGLITYLPLSQPGKWEPCLDGLSYSLFLSIHPTSKTDTMANKSGKLAIILFFARATCLFYLLYDKFLTVLGIIKLSGKQLLCRTT